MSTQTTARGIVGSLRLVGITAALAAGIAGFGTVGAGPAAAADKVATQQFQLDDAKQVSPHAKVPQKACNAVAKGGAPVKVTIKLGCIYIGDDGPILGGPIVIS